MCLNSGTLITDAIWYNKRDPALVMKTNAAMPLHSELLKFIQTAPTMTIQKGQVKDLATENFINMNKEFMQMLLKQLIKRR
ncbi:hypothetical protein HDU98_004833, partial [Podochytrium sp. JEL0797]